MESVGAEKREAVEKASLHDSSREFASAIVDRARGSLRRDVEGRQRKGGARLMGCGASAHADESARPNGGSGGDSVDETTGKRKIEPVGRKRNVTMRKLMSVWQWTS